jgi:peptide/nickel transport system permease protein
MTAAGRRTGRPWLAVAILVAVGLASAFAPWLSPHSPEVGRLPDKLLPPFWMERGSLSHPLGTDHLGRDMLSRLVWGSRISVLVGLLTVTVAASIGTGVGLVAGYFGGRVDATLMAATDVALSMPLMLMAIALVAILGASLGNVVLVVVLLLWPYYARQVRGETLGIKELEFVVLARVANCSNARIIRRHILPSVLPTVLVLATVQVGSVIVLEASLSFLGVGIPPPTPAWGLMVAEGQEVITSAWWVSFWPGLAIFATVLASNLAGDWVRERLDPRLRHA